jgi:hypothetical protein
MGNGEWEVRNWGGTQSPFLTPDSPFPTPHSPLSIPHSPFLIRLQRFGKPAPADSAHDGLSVVRSPQNEITPSLKLSCDRAGTARSQWRSLHPHKL